MAARGCHGFCQAEEILGIAGPEVGIEKKHGTSTTVFLVFRKKNESLRQVERFFLCVRAIMSMHLRSMTIKTLEDFVKYMRTYMVNRISIF